MKAWQNKGLKSLELISNTGDNPNYSPVLPDEDYIKVKVARASLSASDIGVYKGAYGVSNIIPCRSAVALVSESEFESFKIGQRLFLSPYHNSAGGNTYKTRGENCDGYLGDFVYVPISDIYTLPEGVKDEDVIFIEDIALAINALERIDLKKGEYILLYGASYINVIIAELAMYYQAIPIIVDKEQDLLDKAEENGIYYTINVTEENVEQKIIELTAGKLADHLIFDTDCFTHIDEYTSLIKSNGCVCLAGFNKHPESIMCNLQKIIARELTIYSVNDGHSEIPSAINMIANKVINTRNMIEKEISFDDVPQELVELSSKNNYLKLIVKCH